MILTASAPSKQQRETDSGSTTLEGIVSTLNLKPTHKAITAYHDALAGYQHHGVTHETAVRARLSNAFGGMRTTAQLDAYLPMPAHSSPNGTSLMRRNRNSRSPLWKTRQSNSIPAWNG